MEFKHPQPFTLAQISRLDISPLAEEITRLQNSLRHLKSTQDELQQLVDATPVPDAEFMTAIQENKDVIDSQEERIAILQSVLAQKGVPFNPHYDLSPQRSPTRTIQPIVEQADDDNGLHL